MLDELYSGTQRDLVGWEVDFPPEESLAPLHRQQKYNQTSKCIVKELKLTVLI